MSHLWLTGQVHGEIGGERDARVLINRQSSMIDRPEEWVVAVERLQLMNVKLPLFDPSARSCTVTFRNKSTNALSSLGVDFSPYRESDGLIYDLKDVAKAISTCFNTLCSGLFIPQIPIMSFDNPSSHFVISTVTAFIADWAIQFDDNLFNYVPSFDYLNYISSPHELELQDGDNEQHTATIELLSPVSRVVLVSDLPTVKELMPPPFTEQGSIANDFSSQPFLVDFEVNQQNNQCDQKISYSARQTDHQFHNLQRTSQFRDFYIDFYFYDHYNRAYKIKLYKNTKIDIKLYFLKQ